MYIVGYCLRVLTRLVMLFGYRRGRVRIVREEGFEGGSNACVRHRSARRTETLVCGVAEEVVHEVVGIAGGLADQPAPPQLVHGVYDGRALQVGGGGEKFQTEVSADCRGQSGSVTGVGSELVDAPLEDGAGVGRGSAIGRAGRCVSRFDYEQRNSAGCPIELFDIEGRRRSS
jgi:hypothetical protein